MNNYMAHVLFEFGQHSAYVQGRRDPVLPLSVGPMEIMEPAYFHGHYFGRQRFWGDRGEDVGVKVVDGEVNLW